MQLTYLKDKKIAVCGGAGFLGRAVQAQLSFAEISPGQVVVPRSEEYDFRILDNAIRFVKTHQPDVVINLAARLGGIGDNRAFPASYFYDNLMIGINLIEACRILEVERLVNIGTVCSYPKDTPIPFREENLWDGFPEPTNAPYGISKRAVITYARAVEEQYGFTSVHLLLTNLYGPGDDFRPETSHVIPATISKILKAKENNDEFFEAWGDGSPTRDFLFVEDAARGVIQAAEHYYNADPVNLGSGVEVEVKDLIHSIKKHLDYAGEIKWDTSKPNGQPKRFLDISKARKHFGFEPLVSFDEGLRRTIEWYLAERSAVDALPRKFQSFGPNEHYA